ncbi:MAG TPA: PDDEXK nuclease domain-containing protein [Candidatus Cloacimonadota bacterium]|nr:PDDEXK nuclease domain-containing protein [Candidatus Cloacimonadota bacterium]HPM02516.1 PDDEXK nuclease domain-containing protein [Candidatus Cloacimonadota bacterium]
MNDLQENEKIYKQWICKLKDKIRTVQIKMAVSINSELLNFYWELGSDIVFKQNSSKWGDGFLQRLSNDLMKEFPDVKGFSKRNLELIRKWYLFWMDQEIIAKQLVSQLPWGHNIIIVSKSESIEEALFYVKKNIECNWSRSVLVHQMESQLFKREGKSITNFDLSLPKGQSDLATQTLKDPYVFDFLSLTNDYNEMELERELIRHISNFLLELGKGFAYVGRQIQLRVGDREFFIDLLFYHIKLHCYIVIELKTADFEPEHAGKLNFYIKAVDMQYKSENDNPTIGIIVCKSKDKTVAEYALSDISKPIGISEYQLTQSLPDKLKPSLPSIEEIEIELSNL